tara:strand:+ start:31723 stop:32376 length:654 start_codon:yes stop_codon:yes gene_type:complete
MINKNTHIVFDLDDTLYKEIDFVKSAYIYICKYIRSRFGIDFFSQIQECIDDGVNFYDYIISKLHHKHNFSIEKYLELYRFHYPKLSLSTDTSEFLNNISDRKIGFSIITDGRSISQNNKIKALGLSHLAQKIIISEETGYEKPHINNFKIIEKVYPDKKFLYVADNTSKDFLAPNTLKWDTVCLLDNGHNIHKQNFDLQIQYLPKKKINYLKELIV